MLTTSDADATRATFEALALPFQEHDDDVGMSADRMSIADLRGR